MSELSDEQLLEEPEGLGPVRATIEEVLVYLKGAGDGWRVPDEPLDLDGGSAWRPHLVATNGDSVLHVHLTDDLRAFISRRMRAAAEAGLKVHVVVEFSALYSSDLVRELAAVDAHVHVLDGDVTELDPPAHVLAAIGDRGVPVPPDLRRELAGDAWDRRADGSTTMRGKRFEALLSFLLGQITDVRVVERNYRTTTEEVDLVLQVDNWSPRCWWESGVPFVLVEAKNWASPVPQKEVSAFIAKILTKRGRCRIGLMFAASGFTSDADLQEMRLGQHEGIVVALLGPAEIQDWIAADAADDYLEQLIRQAMLR